MSEQAPLFLGSIGLLGKYCPTSRKKYRSPLGTVGCMHLEPFQKLESVEGCSWVQPFLVSSDQLGTEEVTNLPVGASDSFLGSGSCNI